MTSRRVLMAYSLKRQRSTFSNKEEAKTNHAEEVSHYCQSGCKVCWRPGGRLVLLTNQAAYLCSINSRATDQLYRLATSIKINPRQYGGQPFRRTLYAASQVAACIFFQPL